jgi:hypothetical protein
MSQKQNSRNATLFIEELKKASAKLATQYGLLIPDFVSAETDDGIYINLTAYNKKPSEIFAELFHQRSKELGLEPAWLGSSFLNPKTGRKLTIMGLDPDGGDWCVRLTGDDGFDYHMSPAAVSTLIVSNVSKL